MSYRNKGSMAATVTVSREPDRSGNYVCNGTADDVEIQAAIDRVTTLGGGMIFMRAGIYSLTAKLSISSTDVCICGEGNATELTQPNGQNLTHFIELLTGSTYFMLRNIYLNGNRVNNINTVGVGVPGGNVVNRVWIEGNRIQYFPATGLIQRGNIWYVSDNYITECYGAESVLLSGSADSIYYSNQIGGAGGTGGMALRVSTGAFNIFAGNKLFGATDYLLYLDCSTNSIFDGNIIGGCCPTAQYDAIYLICYHVDYGKYNIFSNNLIYGVDRDALRFKGSEVQYNTVEGNIIRDVGGKGYYAEDGTENNNIIEDNAFYSIVGSPVVDINGTNSIASDNVGYNPIGIIATPFDTPNTMIELSGVAATPTANTDYTITTTDIKISSTDSGNTDCAIMLKDPAGANVLQAALSTIEHMNVPVGYILNWGAYTGAAPTVTVSFV